MKNILIVEDDDFKADSLCDYLNVEFDLPHVVIAKSLQEAIEEINKSVFDLVFVDMAIPSHSTMSGGGSPISFLTGGLDVLMELAFLGRKDPCVVITQYPDIEISGEFFSVEQSAKEIRSQLNCRVLACLEYRQGDEMWKNNLREVIGSEYSNSGG